MTRLPPLFDLSRLSHAEKDALIMALWTHLDDALARIDELREEGPAGGLRRTAISGLGVRLARRRGHAEDWPVCLAHQRNDLQYAIDGQFVFLPVLKNPWRCLGNRNRDLYNCRNRIQ